MKNLFRALQVPDFYGICSCAIPILLPSIYYALYMLGFLCSRLLNFHLTKSTITFSASHISIIPERSPRSFQLWFGGTVKLEPATIMAPRDGSQDLRGTPELVDKGMATIHTLRLVPQSWTFSCFSGTLSKILA